MNFTFKNFLLPMLFLALGNSLNLQAQCLNAPEGQFPAGSFTPACSGVLETVTAGAWTGEYALINVVEGQAYTFSSSVGSHYVTIANFAGNTPLAFGTTPVNWTSNVTGQIRFLTHLSAACDFNTAGHSKFVQCSAPPPPPPACGGTYTSPGFPGSYPNNSPGTPTIICPDQPGGVVTVDFTTFGTEACCDYLFVHDGPDASFPLIASTQGNGGYSGTFAAFQAQNGGSTSFTSTHPSGCLTFRFTSDSSVVGIGFSGDITCSTPPPPQDGACDDDQVAPIITYPAQDISITLDPCDLNMAHYSFYVNATDNCDGDVNATVTATGTGDFNLINLGAGGPGSGTNYHLMASAGVYQVVITSTDFSGNQRIESFFVVVNQAPAPNTNLACLGQINVSVGANCTALITPSMVLSGNFGCLTDDDFTISINGENTNVVSAANGCGTVEYMIERNLPPVIEGFNGGFAPANWTTTTVGAVAANTGLTFLNNNTLARLRLQGTSGPGQVITATASVAAPNDGVLSFDWNYQGTDVGWAWFIFQVNSNGTITQVANVGTPGFPTGAPGTAAGSVDNLNVSEGDVLLFVNSYEWALGAQFVQVDLTNWNFAPNDDGAFQPCWGTILVEDKTPPVVTAPCEDMGQELLGWYIESGAWNGQSFNYNACLGGITGAAAPGNQTDISYATISFTVPITGEYFIDMGNNPAIAADYGYTPGNGVDFYLTANSVGLLVQGAWNPASPCNNVIVGGNNGSPVAPTHPAFAANLTAGQTYTLVSWDIAGFNVVPILPFFPTANVFFTASIQPQGATQACVIGCNQVDDLLNATTLDDLRALGIPDPIVNDNCTVSSISFTVGAISSTDICADRTVTITYSAVDQCGNVGTATRVIEVAVDNLETICNGLENYDGDNALSCTDPRLPAVGNPGPDITGRPSGTGCNIECVFTDINFPLCGLASADGREPRKILRRWTCINWCPSAGGQVAECEQIIKIKDDAAPTITPNEPTLVELPYDCEYRINLAIPTVSDVCTPDATVTYQVRVNGGAWGPIVNPYFGESGTTLTVDYRAIDVCGNVSEVVTRTYDLIDRIPPYAICETFRVASIGANCRLIIHAEAFDDGSWDNCGIERMEVRRMTPQPICNIGTAFGPSVEFCCEDIVQGPNPDINNHPSQVIFRVTDTSGNTNECMVRVRVEDKLPPVTQNLPNLTIDCNDEILHWSGWAAVPANSTLTAARYDELDELFGRLLAAQIGDNSGRRAISVAISNARIGGIQGGFPFLDGTYYDNCLNTACVDMVRRAGFVAGPDCRTGVITRTFTVTDRGGNVRTVTQSITVTNFYPFMGGPNSFSPNSSAYNAVGYFTTFRSGNAASLDPRTWPIYAPTSGAAGAQNGNNEYGEPRSIFRALGTGGATSVTATGANGYPTRFDMVWPADLDVTDCAQGLDPDALAANAATRTGSRPYLWREDVCSTVGVTYDEWVFDFEAGCKKVIRKWKAIDWCQSQSITNPWFHHQVIKVVDTAGPSFVSVTATVRPGTDVTAQCGQTEAVVFEFLEGCENAAVRFVVEAFDACATDAEVDAIRWAWEITPAGGGLITSAGQTIPRGNTLTFNQNLPRTLPGGAAHSIKFIAEDGCGNKTTCVIPFRVEDRKKPTPIAFTNLSTEVMPEGPAAGSVQIMASLFNNGSNDNCAVTGFRLGQFTQAGQDTYTGGPRHLRTPVNTHTSLIFVCNSDLLPAGLSADEARGENATQYRLVNPGQVIEVAFWAGDAYGNWDYTIVAVRVDNNMGADCDEGSFTGSVAGLIKTEIEEAVEFAEVDVMVSGLSLGYMNMTNVAGTYMVNVPLFNSYTVAPERNDAIRNGVNVMDIIAIQRHILGVERLESPYQQIAADANRSNTITAQDLVDIRRVLLTPVNFTNNSSWRFVDEAYTFNDPLNALTENFPETITINPMDDDRMDVNFIGVKVGDVNNSVRANSSSLQGTTSRSRAMEIVAAEMNMKAGNEYTVSFRSEDIANVEGYQFTLNFDASRVAFAGYEAVGLNLTDDNFGFALLEEGMVTTAWHTLESVGLTGSDVLFTMTFRALGDVKLSEAIRATSSFTEAMAVSNGTAIGLNLVFETNTGLVGGDVYELFQNQPNPFANETIIGFTLPEAMNATMTVFDVTGKMVKMIEGNYAKGMNNVIIKRSELPASGVLYYQLEAGDFRATKKMIIIE